MHHEEREGRGDEGKGGEGRGGPGLVILASPQVSPAFTPSLEGKARERVARRTWRPQAPISQTPHLQKQAGEQCPQTKPDTSAGSVSWFGDIFNYSVNWFLLGLEGIFKQFRSACLT